MLILFSLFYFVFIWQYTNFNFFMILLFYSTFRIIHIFWLIWIILLPPEILSLFGIFFLFLFSCYFLDTFEVKEDLFYVHWHIFFTNMNMYLCTWILIYEMNIIPLWIWALTRNKLCEQKCIKYFFLELDIFEIGINIYVLYSERSDLTFSRYRYILTHFSV
jgi:hypothetical protein